MQVWDAMCRTILSTGARRGAMMATLRCDHPNRGIRRGQAACGTTAAIQSVCPRVRRLHEGCTQRWRMASGIPGHGVQWRWGNGHA
jgi:hypothetical protein